MSDYAFSSPLSEEDLLTIKRLAYQKAWTKEPDPTPQRNNVLALESDRRRILAQLVTGFLLERDIAADQEVTAERVAECRDLVQAALDLLSMLKRDLPWVDLLKAISRALAEIGEA